jgi:hypothetical protein
MDADDPLDTVSGTLGFTGAADSVLVLNRDSQGVTFYGRGRDIEEIETAVQFDRELCRWNILGLRWSHIVGQFGSAVKVYPGF